MELLCPTSIGVHLSHYSEEAILILTYLMLREALTAECLCEDCLNLRIGVFLIIELLDTMVGEFATVLGKEVVTLLKCVNHILE